MERPFNLCATSRMEFSTQASVEFMQIQWVTIETIIPTLVRVWNTVEANLVGSAGFDLSNIGYDSNVTTKDPSLSPGKDPMNLQYKKVQLGV